MKLRINKKTLKLKGLSIVWVKKKIQTETTKYVQNKNIENTTYQNQRDTKRSAHRKILKFNS